MNKYYLNKYFVYYQMNMGKKLNLIYSSTIFFLFFSNILFSQVEVEEYTDYFKTYKFSDPNPIPIFLSNPKIYPYFTFDGYSLIPTQNNFKVIEIENNFIRVLIAPEIGGKVLGAVDKTSGNEFIYKNEVVKYRNISMRGPWTSGGIEFNFGIIGHHPSTATPVDYTIVKNDDGSVSCFVGNIDLPSRTQWRVEIKLNNNQSSFMTNALWYNPSPINQSYYNWMTAAAPAKDDLEFYIPGNVYLEHNGNAHSWPFDFKNRDLSKYANNNFGPNKSYHIVGEYNDFFGGYYKNDNIGFGHWGEHIDIPGQKLWLWSQSRSGGIWEDLLTDEDGQYIEFQAGRLFVQYSPEEKQNPISNVNFEPYTTDSWSEAWFPIKEIGGLCEASKFGALNIIRGNDSIDIKINPFIETSATLEVTVDNKLFLSKSFETKPMDVISYKIKLDSSNDFVIKVKNLDLNYSSDNKSKIIERSFINNEIKKDSSSHKSLQIAKENIYYREYEKAKLNLEKLVKKDKYNIEAIYHLGELYFRSGNFNKSLDIIKRGLNIDTYNPSLNYMMGVLYKETGNYIDSKEALGWAARSIKYRSNAYSQIADIFLIERDFKKALEYALKSLEFNVKNIPSLEVKAIANRYLKDTLNHKISIQSIYDIDPINHIIPFEEYMISPSTKHLNNVRESHRSELINQTYLELAIKYYNKGLIREAIKILEIGPDDMLNKIWLAYLNKDVKIIDGTLKKHKIDFVFPFRRETIQTLNWAKSKFNDWRFEYLLALNLYGKGRFMESINLLSKIGEKPTNSIFYLNRGKIFEKQGINPKNDFEKAYTLDNKNWRVSRALSKYKYDSKEFMKAYKILKESFVNDTSNYIIGMDYVKVLLRIEKYKEAISILDILKILPYEHAGEGRKLYVDAYHGLSLEHIKKNKFKKAICLLNQSKKWPETLGVGKPYNPDERIENYLLSHCYEKIGDKLSKKYISEIVEYSIENIHENKIENILGYIAIKKMNGEFESDNYIKNLTHKHGINSSNIKFILNFQKNEIVNEYIENDFIKEILTLK